MNESFIPEAWAERLRDITIQSLTLPMSMALMDRRNEYEKSRDRAKWREEMAAHERDRATAHELVQWMRSLQPGSLLGGAVRGLLDLHAPEEDHRDIKCRHCRDEWETEWPCETIVALLEGAGYRDLAERLR